MLLGTAMAIGDARAVIGHQRGPGAHEQRGAAASGDPLRVTANRAGMRGVANEREADPGLFGPLDRARGPLHHRDGTETVAAIDHQSSAAIMDEPWLRLGIDLAGRQ